jgi:hypothetical protein
VCGGVVVGEERRYSRKRDGGALSSAVFRA